MNQSQLQIRVNINFLPFNVIKISSGEYEEPEVKDKKEKHRLPEYYVPKTTKPINFEIRFDENVFYPMSMTSD